MSSWPAAQGFLGDLRASPLVSMLIFRTLQFQLHGVSGLVNISFVGLGSCYVGNKMLGNSSRIQKPDCALLQEIYVCLEQVFRNYVCHALGKSWEQLVCFTMFVHNLCDVRKGEDCIVNRRSGDRQGAYLSLLKPFMECYNLVFDRRCRAGQTEKPTLELPVWANGKVVNMILDHFVALLLRFAPYIKKPYEGPELRPRATELSQSTVWQNARICQWHWLLDHGSLETDAGVFQEARRCDTREHAKTNFGSGQPQACVFGSAPLSPGRSKIWLCTGCRRTWYCSAPCQRRDWRAHKELCHQFRVGAGEAPPSPQQRDPQPASSTHTAGTLRFGYPK